MDAAVRVDYGLLLAKRARPCGPGASDSSRRVHLRARRARRRSKAVAVPAKSKGKRPGHAARSGEARRTDTTPNPPARRGASRAPLHPLFSAEDAGHDERGDCGP